MLKALCVVALIVSGGCASTWRSWWLDSNAKDIANATKAIETASGDGERARAYSTRGRSRSERARYSRAFKLIGADEYEQLFDLAIKDHDQAVLLAPGSGDGYFDRGRTNYDRAALEELGDETSNAFFASAESDFTHAIERDGRNVSAFDFRALVYATRGDLDRAIADFTKVMELDPHLGKLRLAEAHCERAGSYQKASNYDAAIADYEKAISFHTGEGGCDCQPDSPLAWIYLEKHQYDKSWSVVRKAMASGRWIAPEVIQQLKAASGSTGASS